MQNRYTGDIGDYGKLGMLRQLSRTGMTIGVNWYLTPDETHNGDGMHTNYLNDQRFRGCDEYLWNELGRIVNSGKRQVSALEQSGLLRAKYFSQVLDFEGAKKPERPIMRWEWHSKAMERLSGCDIVFVDPDNGLIVPSEEGTTKSNKFVLPFELADYYRAGASVIYYQHKARRPDEFYVEQHRQLLCSGGFPNAVGLGLKFRTTSLRYYFCAVQPHHKDAIFGSVRSMISGEWGKHFSLMP